MFCTCQVKIHQSKKLSQKIAEYVRECDDIYDMAIMVKLAHPSTSTYDMINLIPGWRCGFGLKEAARMHESAALQAWKAHRTVHPQVAKATWLK